VTDADASGRRDACLRGRERDPNHAGDDGAASAPTDRDADAGQSVGHAVGASRTPFDLFMRIDPSGSMSDPVGAGGTKSAALTGAIGSFVAQPLDDLSVGVQYFGVQPSLQTAPMRSKPLRDRVDRRSSRLRRRRSALASSACRVSDPG